MSYNKNNNTKQIFGSYWSMEAQQLEQ